MWGPFCNDYIPKVHELKILPEYFWQVWHGNKTFELRKNDRNYNAGDKAVSYTHLIANSIKRKQ